MTTYRYAMKTARDIELGRDFMLPRDCWDTPQLAVTAMFNFFQPGVVVQYAVVDEDTVKRFRKGARLDIMIRPEDVVKFC